MRCSVIIPAYNSESTIVETLRSIVPSLRAEDEVLVIDDGSRDETSTRADGVDPRVRILRVRNGGVARARNLGIREASGELVAFCDADDIWKPEKLERQRRAFRDRPQLGLCFTDYEVISSDGTVLVRSARRDRALPEDHDLVSMLRVNPVMTSSAVALKRVVEEAGGFPTDISYGEDIALWLEIAARRPVAMLPEVLASYRLVSTSITRSSDPEIARRGRIDLIRRVSERHADRVKPRQARRAIADYCYRCAYEDLTHGARRRAGRYLLRSLREAPFAHPKAYAHLALLPLRRPAAAVGGGAGG
ncbi:MAG: glycosyltransferase family 2 protein [Candidatus Krumholzibacteriia bacterium]